MIIHIDIDAGIGTDIDTNIDQLQISIQNRHI